MEKQAGLTNRVLGIETWRTTHRTDSRSSHNRNPPVEGIDRVVSSKKITQKSKLAEKVGRVVLQIFSGVLGRSSGGVLPSSHDFVVMGSGGRAASRQHAGANSRYDNSDLAKQADRLKKELNLNYYLKLSALDIQESIKFLMDMELVEKTPTQEDNIDIELDSGENITLPHKDSFGLSAKGLQLAHQRKAERSQSWTNRLLTLILISLGLIPYWPYGVFYDALGDAVPGFGKRVPASVVNSRVPEGKRQ